MEQQEAVQWGREAGLHLKPDSWVSGRWAGRMLSQQLMGLRKQLFVGSEQSTEEAVLLLRSAKGAAGEIRGQFPALSRAGDLPRVLLLAREAAEKCRSDRELYLYIKGVQSVTPLLEQELALFPDFLRIALAERLSAGEEELPRLTTLHHALNSSFVQSLTAQSVAEQLLTADPQGLYLKLDEESRAACRTALSRTARRQRTTEQTLGDHLLRQAKAQGRSVVELLWREPKTAGWYPLTLLLLAGLLAVGFGWLTRTIKVGILAFLPSLFAGKHMVDSLALRLLPPCRPVLRLKLDAVPKEGRTLVIVPALLHSQTEVEALNRRLRDHGLVSRSAGEEVAFGLLVDFGDSTEPPTEVSRTRLTALRQSIAQLNHTTGQRFFLFAREPVFDARERCWRGWERKRGALLELARLLRHDTSGTTLLEGEADWLTEVRFLLTLDEDSRLLPDTVEKLIAAALCPLNRPVVGAKGVVTAGFGILQPTLRPGLPQQRSTRFARFLGGGGGMSRYLPFSGNDFMRLFGRDSFTGKGLLDIDTFLTCLDGQLPEGRVLSHDLLEGEYLRTGLVSDACVLESVPQTALAGYRRLHRWIRGDWQNGAWTFGKLRGWGFSQAVDNPLPPLSRWRVLENLLRSLFPLSTLLLLGLLAARGWILSLGLALLLWWTVERGHPLLRLLLLPCESWIGLSGAAMALWRLNCSHKKLLQWSVGRKTGGERLPTVCRQLLPAMLLGGLLCLRSRTIVGTLLGAVWLLSPVTAWLLGKREEQRKISETDQHFLRTEAARIWRYFDTFLRSSDHFLSPDHVWERPRFAVDHRTSPTDLGMGLLACLAALDLSLTTEAHALTLITRTLDTMEGLERCRGHFFNWYDTETLAPLPPRTLSTVDSGNLCASLLTLSQGLRERGQTILAECPQKLAEAMDFSFLYDGARHLFRVDWNAETGTFSPACYDLYCSEARLTSYLAIALGQVEAEHWKHLGRPTAGQGESWRMLSWSGTAFEYLLPQQFLPTPPDSLSEAAVKSCIRTQRWHADEQWGLWGRSECLTHMDESGGLNYEAVGTPCLSLRGIRDRKVLSPYSGALALPFDPDAAIKDLKKFNQRGMSGLYGYYDAVDLTEVHDKKLQVWMSHHAGMTLLGIDNLLNGGCMVNRFQRDPRMGAFLPLLEEESQK